MKIPNFARTGFSSTYRATAYRYGSSKGNDANRSCYLSAPASYGRLFLVGFSFRHLLAWDLFFSWIFFLWHLLPSYVTPDEKS